MQDNRYSTFHAGPEFKGYEILFRQIPQFSHEVAFPSRPTFGPRISLQLYSPVEYYSIYLRARADEDVFDLFQERSRGWAHPKLIRIDKVREMDSPDGSFFGRKFRIYCFHPAGWPENAPAITEVH